MSLRSRAIAAFTDGSWTHIVPMFSENAASLTQAPRHGSTNEGVPLRCRFATSSHIAPIEDGRRQAEACEEVLV